MTRLVNLYLLVAILYGLLVSRAACAATIGFGSGANQFTLEFVPIGNPAAAADTTGSPNPAGSVGYVYEMGKYEVSVDMVDKANAAGGLGITHDARTANKPATGISWNEAARFVNWLNTSQGFQPAYKFAVQPGAGGYSANSNILLWDSSDAGFNAANPFRSTLARYTLPSVNEWYKAAYYDAGSGNYFDYPTGSNSPPTAVSSGTTAGTAVFNGQIGPADITLVGGLSPYGTMGQGGNVNEWIETTSDLLNNLASSNRDMRGGSWLNPTGELGASFRTGFDPTSELLGIGFRVASVPEPSTFVLAALGLGGLLLRRGKRKRHEPTVCGGAENGSW